MKLLLDQNLPHSIVPSLSKVLPGSVHVRDVGLDQAGDDAIWEFAKARDFTIVTKDSDFHQRSFALGFPPKVIWLRVGNLSTKRIREVLLAYAADILAFGADDSASFLIVTHSED